VRTVGYTIQGKKKGGGSGAPPRLSSHDRRSIDPPRFAPMAALPHWLFLVLALLGLIPILKRLPISAPQGAWRLMPYSIGGLAAYWTIDRVMSFIPVAA